MERREVYEAKKKLNSNLEGKIFFEVLCIKRWMENMCLLPNDMREVRRFQVPPFI